MLNVEGEIGVLYQDGRQVAGVYNWESHVVLNTTTVNGMKEYKPNKHLNARSYWLVKPIEENAFYFEGYKVINDRLVIMEAGNVAIDFPDCYSTDLRQYAPVSMRWLGDNEH